MKTLKSIEKEFDETFKDNWFVATEGKNDVRCEQIKSFYASKIEELVKGIVPKHKCCGGDLQMNDEYEQCHGFNEAIDQIQENINKVIGGK